MRKTLERFRDCPASARISAELAWGTSRAPSKSQFYSSAALVRLRRTESSTADWRDLPRPPFSALQKEQRRTGHLAARLGLAQPTKRTEEDAPGQDSASNGDNFAATGQHDGVGSEIQGALTATDYEDGATNDKIQTSLREAEELLRPDDFRSWERLLIVLRHKHGSDGIWAAFKFMEAQDALHALAHAQAEILRDEILRVSLGTKQRLAAVWRVVQHLDQEHEFQWPEIYIKVLHHMLEQERYDDAVRWHLYLAPRFMPETDVFAALLSSFLANPNEEMQSSLTSLYIFSSERKMYDHIIPALYDSGQSKLARRWRRRCLMLNDVPTTLNVRPFLRFLACYYPGIRLIESEMAIAGLEGHENTVQDKAPESSRDQSAEPKGIYSDSLVARWFASSWTSVEFAINLMHRIGLRSIGPLSLQSLALRESSVQDLTVRISQLEKLGIRISGNVYCKALVTFAKDGKESLVGNLIRCDIHPDEFDDAQSRQMILKASFRSGDEKRAELLQGIEQVIGSGSVAERLNSLLGKELDSRKFGQAKVVLDRMEAMKVDIAQPHAKTLLRRAFWMVGYHPIEDRLVKKGFVENHGSRLDRAIEISRQIAFHDVALPLEYWKILLYNLGRRGRLDELEQLSLEICQLYNPPYGGLVPIHQKDLPLTKEAKDADKKRLKLNRNRLAEAREAAKDEIVELPIFAQSRLREKNKTKRKEVVDAFQPAAWKAKPSVDETDDLDAFEIMAQQMAELRRSSDKEPGKSDDTAKESQSQPEPPPPESGIPQDRVLDNHLPGDKFTGSRNNAAADTPIARNAYKAKEKEYIPADLPFSHREHPIQKIFDTHFQRSVVRWGFDQSLQEAGTSSFSSGRAQPASGSDVDVARGVRLLARLRDSGALIDVQVLRATVLSRIAVGQLPGRRRASAWDAHEMSAWSVKRLVEAAWGTDFLKDVDLELQMEKKKSKAWDSYPKLLTKWVDPLPEDDEDW